MNWDAVGAIAEAVGAAGVVATLAYLSVQLRSNTMALRTTSRQHVASVGSRMNDMLMQAEVGACYSTGLRSYPDMSATDKRTFVYAFNNYANAIQEALAYYEGGTLDRETFQAHLDGFAAQLVTPGGTALWRECREFFPSGFAALVDERIGEGGLADILQSPYFAVED